MNASAAPEERVVEDGHLDEEPSRLARERRPELERGVRSERGAADDGAVELQVIDQSAAICSPNEGML